MEVPGWEESISKMTFFRDGSKLLNFGNAVIIFPVFPGARWSEIDSYDVAFAIIMFSATYRGVLSYKISELWLLPCSFAWMENISVTRGRTHHDRNAQTACSSRPSEGNCIAPALFLPTTRTMVSVLWMLLYYLGLNFFT